MSTELIRPARNLAGSLVLPGDKSISHRYAMLAGLAEGTTRLSNFSTGADPHSSLACMEALGAKVTHHEKHIEIIGTAGKFQQPAEPLECGNSGSTMRMLSGLIAPHTGTFTPSPATTRSTRGPWSASASRSPPWARTSPSRKVTRPSRSPAGR